MMKVECRILALRCTAPAKKNIGGNRLTVRTLVSRADGVSLYKRRRRRRSGRESALKCGKFGSMFNWKNK